MTMALEKLRPMSVLLTGANRGVGLALIKYMLKLPSPPGHIFAACRSPETAEELIKISDEESRVHVIKLDVTDHACFDAVVDIVEKTLGGKGLNLLINNAGVLLKDRTLDVTTANNFRHTYEVNAVGPLFLSKALIPSLIKAARESGQQEMSCSRAAIINITSKMGSIADNGMGGSYSYRCSKVALNMLTRSLAVDYKEQGVLAVTIHPGWVKSDMGGPSALIETDQSASGILRVMAELTAADTGTFKCFDGSTIPW